VWVLRLVGSLKLQVSFAEYRLFYRALLQKRPVILRSLPIAATPLHFARTEIAQVLEKWHRAKFLKSQHAATVQGGEDS